MAQSRVPLTSLFYFCMFTTASLMLLLMTYAGVFDGLGDGLVEIIKPIAKYFFE